jgi:(2Fe-2S) ferredoxin
MKVSKNPYKKHIFVCTNQRENGEVSCAGAGEEICESLKAYVKDNHLKGKVRVSRSGCFDFCAQGPNVVVLPDSTWYSRVTLQDLDEIIREHFLPLKKEAPLEKKD